MKTLQATYKGDRVVELSEDVDLPDNIAVFVIIPDDDDDSIMKAELRLAAEQVFAKLWDNEEDEVWNEYLQAT